MKKKKTKKRKINKTEPISFWCLFFVLVLVVYFFQVNTIIIGEFFFSQFYSTPCEIIAILGKKKCNS